MNTNCAMIAYTNYVVIQQYIYNFASNSNTNKMSTFAKTIVTIGILLVFFLIFGIIVGSSKTGRPGIIGLILVAGLIGAIRAIWKKPKHGNNSKEDSNNSSILQK